METPWFEPFKRIPADEVAALARQTRGTIELTFAGQLPPESLGEDLGEAWRRYAEIYFDTLAEQRLPNQSELEELETIARRRFHQSVGLAEFQRAFRGGARVLLDIALERSHELDAGKVAALTLRFEDMMATAAERAYLEEQRLVGSTLRDTARATMLRLLSGELQPDADEVAHVSIGGQSLSGTFTTVNVAVSQSAARAPVDEAAALARLESALDNVLPYAIQLRPSEDVLVLMCPGDSVEALAGLVRGLLTSSPSLSILRAGISHSRIGVRSLPTSNTEAKRARLLGEVLQPSQPVYAWQAIGKVDIFRDGEALNRFVNDTIGPLIVNDQKRGTQLVQTLAAYLDTDRNRKATARVLTVHINTLDYRLRQVQALLGDNSLTSHPFNLHLATRLYPFYDRTSLAAD